jgi:anti-sigma factor RsiW
VNHPEMEAQVDALLDGELAPADAAEIEAHLATCASCARFRAERLALRAAIGSEIPLAVASPELRARVRSAVRREAGRPARVRARLAWTWLAAAATVALVATGSWQLGASRARAGALADQVLASHVRSLMPGHLSDVVSSDQHTVKPWFDGRLDFSPPVHDFAGRGYPLLGGRVDYVGGRLVAALAYAPRRHIVSVYVWPSNGTAPVSTAPDRNGYHVIHWATPAFTWWLASDIGAAELREFGAMLRLADAAAAASGNESVPSR